MGENLSGPLIGRAVIYLPDNGRDPQGHVMESAPAPRAITTAKIDNLVTD